MVEQSAEPWLLCGSVTPETHSSMTEFEHESHAPLWHVFILLMSFIIRQQFAAVVTQHFTDNERFYGLDHSPVARQI